MGERCRPTIRRMKVLSTSQLINCDDDFGATSCGAASRYIVRDSVHATIPVDNVEGKNWWLILEKAPPYHSEIRLG